MARTEIIPDRFNSVEQIVWSDASVVVTGKACQGDSQGGGYEHAVMLKVVDEDGVFVELDLGAGEAQRIIGALSRAIAGVTANS